MWLGILAKIRIIVKREINYSLIKFRLGDESKNLSMYMIYDDMNGWMD